MSERVGVPLVAALLLCTAGVGAQEPVDREMVERIKAEGRFSGRVCPAIRRFTTTLTTTSGPTTPTMDTFERIDSRSLEQAAIVMASILYHAAMRDEKMPCDPTWRPGR